MKYLQRITTLITITIICGCAGTPPTHTIINPPIAPKHQEQSQTELPPASFNMETLYTLLVAELAGQRKRYDILLDGYMGQANKTQDAGIAKRATHIATWMSENETALTAAELWLKIAPNDNKAQQSLVVQLIRNGQLDKAMLLLHKMLDSGHSANFEYLAINTSHITKEQRSKLITQFDQLLKTHPKHPSLLFSKSILLQMNGQIKQALKYAWKLDKVRHDSQSILLTARLQHQLGETLAALKQLKTALKKTPNNNLIRLLYAQTLIAQKQYQQAYIEFNMLLDKAPDNKQVRMSLALISMELNKSDEAKKHLHTLIKQEQLQASANYYLAQIAEQEKDHALAIKYYSKIISGPKSIPAHARLGTLLLITEQHEEMKRIFTASRNANTKITNELYALEASLFTKHGMNAAALATLNEAIKLSPKNINLLYSRAMAAEKLNNIDALEKDLRTILSLQPDNAIALNTLGYILTNRTNRYQEAFDLINKANELKPNDPAIIDSLGWVLFRLGNYKEAILLLEKALSNYPDHEVSAHLSEALWMNGEHQRAKIIWQEALKRTPNSDIIKRLIKRLNTKKLIE